MNDLSDLSQISAALDAGKWWIATAIAIMAIVRLMKASATLAEKIPPRARTPFAFALALVSSVASTFVQGTPIVKALFLGTMTAAFACWGHQLVVESARGGRELLEPKPGGEDHKGDDTKNVPIGPVVILVILAGLVASLARGPVADARQRDTIERLSNLPERAMIAPAAGQGCALFTPKNINSALDALQIACIFESQITDEQKLASACGIAQDLIPVVRKLVGQREAAKRAGVSWHREPVDAGADAAVVQ